MRKPQMSAAEIDFTPRKGRQGRRSTTIPVKRLTRAEMRKNAGDLIHLSDYERPKTRGDCEDADRPCPWVSCRYNLYLDVGPTGTIKFNFPDKKPWEMKNSCALDGMSNGDRTLEKVGEYLNLTRERIRQIEASLLEKLRECLDDNGEITELGRKKLKAAGKWKTGRREARVLRGDDGLRGLASQANDLVDDEDLFREERLSRLKGVHKARKKRAAKEEPEMAEMRKCKECKDPFKPKHHLQKYCAKHGRSSAKKTAKRKPVKKKTAKKARRKPAKKTAKKARRSRTVSLPNGKQRATAKPLKNGTTAEVSRLLEMGGFNVEAVAVPSGTMLFIPG